MPSPSVRGFIKSLLEKKRQLYDRVERYAKRLSHIAPECLPKTPKRDDARERREREKKGKIRYDNSLLAFFTTRDLFCFRRFSSVVDCGAKGKISWERFVIYVTLKILVFMVFKIVDDSQRKL